MVKVNLLQAEAGKAKKIAIPEIDIQKPLALSIGLSLLFFLVGIFFRVETAYRRAGLSNITKEYQQEEERVRKINALKQEKDTVAQEAAYLNGYLKRNIIWSQKLAQLRKIIPKEVWLTNLSFEKKTGKDTQGFSLYLKGGLIPQDKTSPLGTLTKFINKLKEDKDFFIDFDNPVLTDFRTELRENTEIITFAIEMPFKAG